MTAPALRRCKPSYNRSVKIHLSLVAAVVLLLSGCNRGIESKEAVRQAVIDYLSKQSNLNVSSMQVDVTSVSFREGEADATVAFRAKGAGGGSGMTMNYTLARQGNRWVVKGKSQAGGSPHGMMGGSQSGQMPAGHPPVGGQEPSGTAK